MSSSFIETVKIFYCYAPEDRALLDQLDKQLSPLKRFREITSWSDCDIHAGKDWAQEIQTHLAEASIVLVLLSPDFIASDYCYNEQMQTALHQHHAGKACIIPIIVRPVIWEETELGNLQALPTNRKPITSWTNLDEALWDVARGVRQAVKGLLLTKIENVTDLSTQQPHEEIPSAEQSLQTAYNMINTKEAVHLFHQLMHINSKMRALHFIGAGKMGKSHLLTKVFPILAHQKYQARCLLFDLRNPVYTVPDILYALSSQLDSHICDSYLAAYEAWVAHPTSPKKSEHLRHKNYYLTSCFVKELAKLDDTFLLFLFDSVNSTRVQTWLMDVFLPQIVPFRHIRVILAGRSLPDSYSNIAAICGTYQLSPITDEQAYLEFCKNLHLNLGEQSIRDFAYACNYTPGIFAELVLPKFALAGER